LEVAVGVSVRRLVTNCLRNRRYCQSSFSSFQALTC
jgi:hypothetical protein